MSHWPGKRTIAAADSQVPQECSIPGGHPHSLSQTPSLLSLKTFWLTCSQWCPFKQGWWNRTGFLEISFSVSYSQQFCTQHLGTRCWAALGDSWCPEFWLHLCRHARQWREGVQCLGRALAWISLDVWGQLLTFLEYYGALKSYTPMCGLMGRELWVCKMRKFWRSIQQ